MLSLRLSAAQRIKCKINKSTKRARQESVGGNSGGEESATQASTCRLQSSPQQHQIQNKHDETQCRKASSALNNFLDSHQIYVCMLIMSAQARGGGSKNLRRVNIHKCQVQKHARYAVLFTIRNSHDYPQSPLPASHLLVFCLTFYLTFWQTAASADNK